MSKDEKNSVTAMSPTISLVKYKALVDRCARDRLNLEIANGSAAHARILIDKLFDIATQNVCLVTGSLRQRSSDGEEIYSDERVKKSAGKFLRSPRSCLSVVLQTGHIDGDDQNEFFSEIINDNSRTGNVILYLPRPGVLSHDLTPHFMVSDGAAFRYETGLDANPQNETITAVANFGDAPTARVLDEIFSDIIALMKEDENLRLKRVFAPGQQYTIQ